MNSTGTNRPVAQNCITQFPHTDVIAFLMRLIVFLLVFSTFPILNHFFRSGLLRLIYGTSPSEQSGKLISNKVFNTWTILILLIPSTITVVYPKIADILSYVGAVAGLFVVYILPVVTHLHKLKIESDNPLFAEATQISNMYYNDKMYQEKLPKEMV